MTTAIKAQSEDLLVETKDELAKAIEAAHARISDVAAKKSGVNVTTLLATFTVADFAALAASEEMALVCDHQGLDYLDASLDDGLVANAA